MSDPWSLADLHKPQPGDVINGWVVLPYPPTVNRMYFWRGGRPVLSERARAWRERAIWCLRYAGIYRPLAGPVAITILVYRPRKRGDLDNVAKAILDSLNEIAWEDDSQVVEIIMRRFDDKSNPRVLVKVSPSKQAET